MSKFGPGTRVLHTSTGGGGGWHCTKRVKRTGTIIKENEIRVSVMWDNGKKSSVEKEGLTIIEEVRA